MTELADDLDETMQEIKALSALHPHAQTLINIGWIQERLGQLDQALEWYVQAAHLAQMRQQAVAAAHAWNNIGVIHQKEDRMAEAERACGQALICARQTGEIRTMALILGNLAELQDSLPLIEEALEHLQNAGQADLVAYFEEQRNTFMARSGGN